MIVHVEIPVAALERAVAFYETVFAVRFAQPIDLHESRMAFCDTPSPHGGASWALCQGEVYVRTRNGPILYFLVDDIDATMTRAVALGSEVLFPKTALDDGSHVAEISDSEGNRVALQSAGR